MTDRQLVSVIMPVFNCEDYLEESIVSILNQTYPYLRIYPAGDLNHNSRVDFEDFAIFADNWLAGVE